MTRNLPLLPQAPAGRRARPAAPDPPARGGRPRLRRRQLYLRRFRRNRGAVAGAAILLLLILFAALGSGLTRYSHTDVDFSSLTSPPSPGHPFGTNAGGNDTFAQSVHGLRRSLVIALSVSLLSTVISGLVGAAAAYRGGRAERATLAVTHLLMVLPSFLILALLSRRVGSDWWVLILALTAFGWMYNARLVWALSTSLREREYVQAAHFMGVRPLRIVLRHLIPHLGSMLIVTFTVGVITTVQAETALSFIGFGVQQPDVSLGTMLADGANSLASAPWLFAFPAALVTLLTISVALIGDGLRDAFDPTSSAGGRS